MHFRDEYCQLELLYLTALMIFLSRWQILMVRVHVSLNVIRFQTHIIKRT